MSRESLLNAVELVGGQVALAAAIKTAIPTCKVVQSHIWQWLNTIKSETPPPEYVLAIAAATEYKVTPHDLRPDIYPHLEDGLPESMRGERHAA